MIHTLSGFTNPVMKKHKLVTNVIQHNVLSGNGNHMSSVVHVVKCIIRI